MKTSATVAVMLAAVLLAAAGQQLEAPKGLPMALPNENTWQWLVRNHLCTSGGCQGGSSLAYVNWGDAKAPIYDNIEVAPDLKLIASFPFEEPKPDNPRYDAAVELEIKTRIHDENVFRVYVRGVFVGYGYWIDADELVSL
jgi:hypothetical protein